MPYAILLLLLLLFQLKSPFVKSMLDALFLSTQARRYCVGLQRATTMMDTVQQIAFSFNFSAQRLRFFQAEFELDEDAHAGMNNITNLQ